MGSFKNLSRTSRSNLVTYGIVVVAFAVMQALIATGGISRSTIGLLIPVTVYISLAISLNLVVGISGELSLGHAGFMSIGAFTGVVAVQYLGMLGMGDVPRLVLSLVVGGVCAAIVGFLVGIPVMRLRGDYLAIVTLAFGEIIKNLLNNLYVGIDANGIHVALFDVDRLGMQGGILAINGARGAVGIPRLASFTAGFVLILFTLFVVFNLVQSRSGRAIMAVRDNRIAAESVGISTTKYRMMAFVVASALAGMAGALYAMNYDTILPSKFNFNTSINILVFVVLGGMGNIRGGIISAALLTILPEKLRFLGDLRMLIYAIVLIAVMLASNNQALQARLSGLASRVLRRGRRDAGDDVSADDPLDVATSGGGAAND